MWQNYWYIHPSFNQILVNLKLQSHQYLSELPHTLFLTSALVFPFLSRHSCNKLQKHFIFTTVQDNVLPHKFLLESFKLDYHLNSVLTHFYSNHPTINIRHRVILLFISSNIICKARLGHQQGYFIDMLDMEEPKLNLHLLLTFLFNHNIIFFIPSVASWKWTWWASSPIGNIMIRRFIFSLALVWC